MFIVDEEFAAEVASHKWYLSAHGYYHRNRLKGQEGPRLLHRFIWWLKHGYVPRLLDHINRVKWDNRLENLRPATPTLNAQNWDGCKGGVRFHRQPNSPNQWQAALAWRGKYFYLGLFPTEEAARAYRDDCKRKILAYEEAVSRGENPDPPVITRHRQTAEHRGRPRKPLAAPQRA